MNGFLGHFQRNVNEAVLRRRGFHRQLQCVERVAGIPASHICQMLQGFFVHLYLAFAVTYQRVRQGTLQEGQNILL